MTTYFAKTELTIAELYEITIMDGTVAYFTSHSQDITYQSQTYQAIPITRSKIRYHTDLQVDQVEITLGLVGVKIGTKQLSIPEVIRRGYLRQAHVKIMAVDYTALANHTLLFEGWVSGEIRYTAGTLTISVGSLLDRLQDRFPKLVYSEFCQHNLFSVSSQPAKYTLCELTKADWKVTGTVKMPVAFTGTGLNDMSASGKYDAAAEKSYMVAIDGTGTPDTFKWSPDLGATWPATGVAITGSAQELENGVYVTFQNTTGHTLGDYWIVTVGTRKVIYADIFDWSQYAQYAQGWWEKGELKLTSGNNASVSRTVLVHEQGKVKLLIPFPEDVYTGDAIEAYPGCDKSGKTCDEKFGNYANFFGFEYIPKPDTFFGL